MACLPLESREASTRGSSRAAPPEQLAQLNRSLYSAWRIGSFSSWPPACMEAPDRDAPAMPDAGEPGSGSLPFHVVRGPAPACMRSSKTGRGQGELEALVEPALKAYGLPSTGGTSPRLSWSGCCRPIWMAPG